MAETGWQVYQSDAGWKMDDGRCKKNKKSEALLKCLAFMVRVIDQGLEFCTVCISQLGATRKVIFIFEEHRKHVLRGFPVRVPECEHAGIGTFGKELMFQRVALPVAPDDPACLPVSDFEQKLTSLYSYFAHEQLIYVRGGQEFFSVTPFFPGLSSGSPAGTL